MALKRTNSLLTDQGLRDRRPYDSDYSGGGFGLLKQFWNYLTVSDQDIIDRMVKKQNKKDWDAGTSMNSRLGLDGISEKISDHQLNKGLIASEENLDMYDDSPDTQDKLDIEGFREDRVKSEHLLEEAARDFKRPMPTQAEHGLDQVVEESYDTEMDDARENYLGDHGMRSSGMTDNAFGSKKSGMSPKQKMAMVGLLKDFMSKEPDAPAPQVRGAGIIKGGGTPFPSLLAKKPERPRYVNKGLL